MKETSLEAYRELVADGTIGERQLLAWNVLRQHGPLTGQELAARAEVPGLWKRLSELARFGLVAEVGRGRCGVTGSDAILWNAVVVSAPEIARRRFQARRTFFLAVDESDRVVAGSLDPVETRRVAAERDLEIVEARELRRSS